MSVPPCNLSGQSFRQSLRASGSVAIDLVCRHLNYIRKGGSPTGWSLIEECPAMRSASLVGSVALLAAASASAQEVTLRAISAFAEKTTYSRGFETFIERVNREGRG